MTFFTVNKKFDVDARKAFFCELSTRLEMMAEDLDMETPDSHYDEMIEIITELKQQALHHRVSNYPAVKIEYKSANEVQF